VEEQQEGQRCKEKKEEVKAGLLGEYRFHSRKEGRVWNYDECGIVNV
jgi:hypothetical protein